VCLGLGFRFWGLGRGQQYGQHLDSLPVGACGRECEREEREGEQEREKRGREEREEREGEQERECMHACTHMNECLYILIMVREREHR
jgi:hypothetical protein